MTSLGGYIGEILIKPIVREENKLSIVTWFLLLLGLTACIYSPLNMTKSG